MWHDIRELFPIHRTCVYLNNAGVAPPSVRVLEALSDFHRRHAAQGWSRTARYAREAAARVKSLLAVLLHCSPSSIALLHNTSEGMNVVAQGLAWSPGDAVLGLDREYPANVYPWWNLEKKGVRYIRVRPVHTAQDLVNIERALEPGVRLLAVSVVDWCSGFVLDVQALGEICRRQGVLLVLDVAQALGVVPLDPQAARVAALSGSAWKWLLGPVGVGVFYCSPGLLSRLDPVFVGTDTVVDPQQFLPYKFIPKPDASRFEFSTGNQNDWVFFRASLELLNEIGFDKVQERILYLGDYLAGGLERQGFTVEGRDPAGARSGIVSFSREDLDALQTVQRLAARDIVVRERDGMVRVSPHIYNNEDDLDRLFSELARNA